VLEKSQPIYQTQVRDAADRLIASGLFVERPGRRLVFLGAPAGDYLDVVTDQDLSDEQAQQAKWLALGDVLRFSRARSAYLPHVDEGGLTPKALESQKDRGYLTTVRTMPAPSMVLSESKIDRSSFRRVENRLARHGKVEFHRWTRAEEVLPKLEEFFDLHRRRWAGTDCERYFQDAVHREFFEELTRSLGQTPWLRFAELRLDGRLAAAHFGFRYGQRLLWYKPAYEMEMAKLSPGVALIHRLIDSAVEEGAAEFDFTIGGEAFKSRYATRERRVHDLHLTLSGLDAWRLRGEMALRHWARRTINAITKRPAPVRG
jgi:CelD/BcsL family acetyltransferase involved in cellulose biosynthesis